MTVLHLLAANGGDNALPGAELRFVPDWLAIAEADALLVSLRENPDEREIIGGPACQRIVAIDPRYFRPAEVDTLLGDPSKARDQLGWTPRTGFDELVADMMRADLAHATRDAMVTQSGYQVAQHHE